MPKLSTLTFFTCLFLLSLNTSARILDELISPIPADTTVPPPEADDPNATPAAAPPLTALPSGQIPATDTPPVIIPTDPSPPIIAPVADPPDTVPSPVAIAPSVETPATIPFGSDATVPPVTTATDGGAAVGSTIHFFMHDILGGSRPSGRVVTGVVANSDTNNLPFSKPNNQIFPINGGVPLNTINGAINNNNYPFLIGLNGGGPQSNTIIQSNGNNIITGNNNNNNNQQVFVTAGQLPRGLSLQQLMFGSVTVVDNEITEGHELGTAVLGRAQGFYITSSSDGSSHTLVLTALFHGGGGDEVEDTVSFFGVHRTATPISHLAIVGGTGKYEKAKGYATIETLPHEDQHTTDGVETITHFTLYVTP